MVERKVGARAGPEATSSPALPCGGTVRPAQLAPHYTALLPGLPPLPAHSCSAMGRAPSSHSPAISLLRRDSTVRM